MAAHDDEFDRLRAEVLALRVVHGVVAAVLIRMLPPADRAMMMEGLADLAHTTLRKLPRDLGVMAAHYQTTVDELVDSLLQDPTPPRP